MIAENKPVLLQIRELMRRMSYAYKTENTYKVLAKYLSIV